MGRERISITDAINTRRSRLAQGDSALHPPMWPGFNSRLRRHMCAEFVVGCLLLSLSYFVESVSMFRLFKINVRLQIQVKHHEAVPPEQLPTDALTQIDCGHT